MSTHALGAGTCNLSVNVRRPIRLALGRMAFLVDISMGELVRRMLARAAQIVTGAARAERAAAKDRAALGLLRSAVRDGLQEGDMPAVKRAMALIAASEREDRNIANGIKLTA